ncbi:MAG: hypothetical protein IIB00_06720 [candidate division Zixibacteria bacterium]|nr:hypothetical protein [candidate division Zixibacteria bacterium]
MEVDKNGFVYAVGPTKSGDFPMVNPIQDHIGGTLDAFAVIINPELSYQPVCCATAGDANHDGEVSVGDAIFLVKYIFADGETPFCTEEADSDTSGSISIGDAAYLVKYIFNNGVEPLCLRMLLGN